METTPANLLLDALAANPNMKSSSRSSRRPSAKMLGQEAEQENDINEEIDDQIGALRERMLMNQMPSLGDIRSSETRDVRLRIQAIRALLDFKETKSIEIR